MGLTIDGLGVKKDNGDAVIKNSGCFFSNYLPLFFLITTPLFFVITFPLFCVTLTVFFDATSGLVQSVVLFKIRLVWFGAKAD